MYCPNCGKEILETDKFCQKCGVEQKTTPPKSKANKNLFAHYFDVLKKYATFNGRSSRREYWSFFLINFIIYLVIAFIEGFLGINSESDDSLFGNIYQLAVFIPGLAVGVRRMHDVGKSGWYLLIPIYNFLLTIRSGSMVENKYGPDSKIYN